MENNKCPKGHGVMKKVKNTLFCTLCGLTIEKKKERKIKVDKSGKKEERE